MEKTIADLRNEIFFLQSDRANKENVIKLSKKVEQDCLYKQNLLQQLLLNCQKKLGEIQSNKPKTF